MNFVSIDFETANPSFVSICAAGMAVFEDGKLTEAPYWLVRPPKGHGWFHDDFIECHGMTHLDVLEAPEFPAIAPEFLARLTCADLVIAHHAAFDIGRLRETLGHFGLPRPEFDYVCTCKLARRVWPELPNHQLSTLTAHIGPQIQPSPRPSRCRSRRTGVAGDDETGEHQHAARFVAKDGRGAETFLPVKCYCQKYKLARRY